MDPLTGADVIPPLQSVETAIGSGTWVEIGQTGNGQDAEIRQRGEGNISVVVQSGYN